MQQIISDLEVLRQYTGNAQTDKLNELKSDLLKEVLEYTYDPHKKYKIDEGKYNKVPSHCGLLSYTSRSLDVNGWNEFKKLLDNLSEIKSAKDSTVSRVKNFIETIDNEEQRNFLRMVLLKDLRLNMNIKKFQVVWPTFLVEPQVQLAKPLEDRKIFDRPVYSRKFDGKRVWWDNFIPMSRTNKECSIAPIQHIIDELKNGPVELCKYILDGELLYFEDGKEDFQKGISLCQRDDRVQGCENICYVIFDMIDREKFYAKEPDVVFGEEYQRMLKLLHNPNDYSSPCYSLLPTYFPHVYIARQESTDEKLMPLCIQNKWEGLMVRNADSPYEYKRTTNLLKIKEMHDTELKLIDMEEGTGKHAGRLGAFWVDYNGYKVQVGSGFSDEQRELYWNNREKYIGKMVKVQYFEETMNQQGEKSLRFPVFKSFRDMETMEEFIN